MTQRRTYTKADEDRLRAEAAMSDDPFSLPPPLMSSYDGEHAGGLIRYDLEAPAYWAMAPSMLVMWERCPASDGYVPPDPLPEKCFMADGGFMVHVRSDRECRHSLSD